MNKIFFPADGRGKAEYGWLSARYSFSFANYFNPHNIHFGVLRVLNDDTIEAGRGFNTHPHDNMEIITIPIKGALKHRDSMGHESIIQAGEVQVMSAGTGLTHSEYNASETEEVNLLQIWILPRHKGLEPGYDQKAFSTARLNTFQLLVSPDGRDNSLSINQDAFFSLIQVEEEKAVNYNKSIPENGLYFFLVEGQIDVAGQELNDRDALSLKNEDNVKIEANKKSWLLVLEVPV